MARRTHCIPGAALLGVALLLSMLTAISNPYVRHFDIAHVSFNGNIAQADDQDAREASLGIWGYCYELAKSGTWACLKTGYAYDFALGDQVIGKSWTRGLVIHPIATVIVGAAFILSFFPSVFIMLVAALTAWLAAFMTLIAFFCDIALFAYFKGKMKKIDNAQPSSNPGAGFWMTFVTFFLLCFAGCAVLFGRKRERHLRGDDYVMSSRKPWYHKFRRGRY